MASHLFINCMSDPYYSVYVCLCFYNNVLVVTLCDPYYSVSECVYLINLILIGLIEFLTHW